jgi:hypothetical protein
MCRAPADVRCPLVSPIRKDWLERVLNQLAEALARVLGLRKRGAEEEALEEIHRTMLELFGIPRSMLLSLDARTALEVLAAPRLRQAALQLLDEEEAILRSLGKLLEADALAAWLASTRAAAED